LRVHFGKEYDLDNIIVFNQIDNLLKIASNFMRDKKPLDALDTLRHIDIKNLSSESRSNVLVTKAAIYFNMRLMDKAFDTLMQSFALGDEERTIYMMLSFMFFHTDNFMAVHYYWLFGLEKNYVDSLDELITDASDLIDSFAFPLEVGGEGEDFDFENDFYEDDFDSNEIELLEVKQEKECKSLVAFLGKKYANGEYETVLQAVPDIPKDNKTYYTLAKAYESMCHTKLGDLEKAREVLKDEAIDQSQLFVKGEHIRHALLDKDMDKARALLLELKTRESFSVFESTHMLEVLEVTEFDQEILFFATHILKKEPYDTLALLMAGVACHNQEQYEQAMGYLTLILSVEPGELFAKYYCAQVENRKGRLGYELRFDAEYSADLRKRLREFVKGEDAQVLQSEVEWFVQEYSNELKLQLLQRIVSDKEYSFFLRHMLLKKDVELFAKKDILAALINSQLPKDASKESIQKFSKLSFRMTVEDLMVNLPLKYPKTLLKACGAIQEAYFEVYASIAVVKMGFEKNYAKKALEVVTAFCGMQETAWDNKALCAIFLYFCGGLSKFKTESSCIGFFESSRTVFRRYKRLVQDYLVGQKEKKKNGK